MILNRPPVAKATYWVKLTLINEGLGSKLD